MPTPSGYAQVSLQFFQTGVMRPSYVTFGIDPVETDPLLIAGAVNTAYSSTGSLFSCIDQTCTMNEVRVSLGTDGGEDVIGALATTTAGGSAKTTLPPNCAALVHKVTARGGRRGRGRMFLPWAINEGNVDEAGIISTVELANIQNAVTAFRLALTAGQVPMVLLHDPSAPGTVHPSTPGPPNPVTGLIADKLVSTQRRRLGRR